jgi:hypothetical protein
MHAEATAGGWTPERIREELDAFLAGRSDWPSYRDFQRAGRRTLRDVITRMGGARAWAATMGVAYVERPPGYAPVWTDERIERELREFLRERVTWPSRKEFEAAGRKSLRDAVRRTGGPERWAALVGAVRPDERAGSRRVWTPARIEEELRPLVLRTEGWPTRRQFHEAGLGSMRTAIHHFEGAAYWRQRMGVPQADRPHGGGRRDWTEERIEAELRRFCAERGRFPTAAAFEAAGLGRLYRAASRSGGIARWKRQLGFDDAPKGAGAAGASQSS